MLLLDLFDDIRVKLLGAKNRVFKMNFTGGETPIDDDEEADA